jgi:hypothetical protein
MSSNQNDNKIRRKQIELSLELGSDLLGSTSYGTLNISNISNTDEVEQAFDKVVLSIDDEFINRTYPTSLDKNIIALTTTASGDLACTQSISYTPVGGTFVEVSVNGIQVSVENTGLTISNITKSCFFANPSTPTISKLILNIQAGDSLYWMGANAGYELDSFDKIDLNYVRNIV